MSKPDRDENIAREGAPAAGKPGSQEEPEEEITGLAASRAGVPDMNRDPLAGAMDQGSAQTDSLEHAVEGDTGVAAENEPAGAGGPASRNTSAPAGEEIGRDEPTEGEPNA